MKRWRWRLLALALFAATLALEFPAAALSKWAGWTGGEAQGTWWRGRVAGVRWGRRSTAVLSWSLQPMALAHGKLEFALRLDGDGMHGSALASLRRRAIALRDIRMEFPAGGLAPSAAVPAPGRIRIGIASTTAGAVRTERIAGHFSWSSPADGARLPVVRGTFVADPSRCRATLESPALGNAPLAAFFGKGATRLPGGQVLLDWSGASQGAPASCRGAIRPRRRS